MLLKPSGIISAAGGGAPAFSETLVTVDGATYMANPDASVAGSAFAAGSKQYFMFVSWVPTTALTNRTLVSFDNTSCTLYTGGTNIFCHWQDTLGGVIYDGVTTGGAITVGERAGVFASIDNRPGGKLSLLRFRANPASLFVRSIAITPTDQLLKFHETRSGTTLGCGIIGQTDGQRIQESGIQFARVAVWKDASPDVSLWTATEAANFIDTTTGALVDPATSQGYVETTLGGVRCLDLYGTAAQWNAHVDDSPSGSRWGNLEPVGGVFT